MRRIATTAALLATTAGTAFAGGIERADDSILFMFEEGSYAEFAFAGISPDVSGHLDAAPSIGSGNMLTGYTTMALSYKTQLNDKWSLGIRLSQPHGASISYPSALETGYPIGGSNADLNINAMTAIARYQMENNISVFGGLRIQRAEGEVELYSSGVESYNMKTDTATDYGYLLGVAWERPDIAARVALTYHSAISHDLQSTEVAGGTTYVGEFETITPQSINLEFQTGIAEDTLLFGNIRWAEWTEFNITPPVYGATFGQALVDYENDVITYNMGIGRRFTDTWSGAITLGYEKTNDGYVGNLGPTSGYKSIGLAASYEKDAIKVTFGVEYADLGDAATQIGPYTTTFEDNSAIAAGIRIGYSY